MPGVNYIGGHSAGLRLHGVEQRFRVGVVVAHPWPGEGSEHTQLLHAAFQRGGTHGVAVVGIDDQRLGASLADPLPQAGPVDEISGDLRLLPLGHVPGDHFADPDVDHKIEVEPVAADAGGQVGDVPAPDLIGPSGLTPGKPGSGLQVPGRCSSPPSGRCRPTNRSRPPGLPPCG